MHIKLHKVRKLYKVISQCHEWSLKQMISVIKILSPKKKLSVINLALKRKIKSTFLFSETRWRDYGHKRNCSALF